MGLLTGKRALILGVANAKSIASGIVHAMHREGAEIALTYQNERLASRVEALAAECGNAHIIEGGSAPTYPCDVSSPADIAALVEAVKNDWGHLDILVHSVAFAPREELEGDYVAATTRDGFLRAHEISAWSFTALAQAFAPLLSDNAALLTLTYLGAVRAVPNYNSMGIAKASLEASVRYLAQSMGPANTRVNAVSAGAIRTLAASGIKNFRSLQDKAVERTPLGRTVTIEEVGNAAAFLCSDYASGITGEILYVDGGYNIAAG